MRCTCFPHDYSQKWVYPAEVSWVAGVGTSIAASLLKWAYRFHLAQEFQFLSPSSPRKPSSKSEFRDLSHLWWHSSMEQNWTDPASGCMAVQTSEEFYLLLPGPCEHFRMDLCFVVSCCLFCFSYHTVLSSMVAFGVIHCNFLVYFFLDT